LNLPESELMNAELNIFNIRGQKIRQILISNNRSELKWNGNDDNGNEVSSGIYFYKVTSGKFSSNLQKMILIK
ncbi:MAG: FlgD immunoglobulin-like domain containing protein, partial [Candidatus Cloacimonadota bacterium]|nr:FlgD immunoglobulin-like domain containing protein [Candidatus Cloacimonadota bacterium]